MFRSPARAWGQPLAVLLLQFDYGLTHSPARPPQTAPRPSDGAHPTYAASPRRSGRRLLPPGRRRTRLGAHRARARGTGGAARRPHQGKTNRAADACPVAMGGCSGSLVPRDSRHRPPHSLAKAEGRPSASPGSNAAWSPKGSAGAWEGSRPLAHGTYRVAGPATGGPEAEHRTGRRGMRSHQESIGRRTPAVHGRGKHGGFRRASRVH